MVLAASSFASRAGRRVSAIPWDPRRGPGPELGAIRIDEQGQAAAYDPRPERRAERREVVVLDLMVVERAPEDRPTRLLCAGAGPGIRR